MCSTMQSLAMTKFAFVFPFMKNGLQNVQWWWTTLASFRDITLHYKMLDCGLRYWKKGSFYSLYVKRSYLGDIWILNISNNRGLSIQITSSQFFFFFFESRDIFNCHNSEFFGDWCGEKCQASLQVITRGS